MVSQARINANRQNARRSTGPKSNTGKAIAALNSLKHGETATTRFPAEMAQRIKDRAVGLAEQHGANTDFEHALMEIAAAALVKMDSCRHRLAERETIEAARAAGCWDEDRRAAVAKRAAMLGQNPNPIAAELRQSRHGVEWLLDQWNRLDLALAEQGGWTSEFKALAMDLRGEAPTTREVDPLGLDTATVDELSAFVADEIQALAALKDQSLDAIDAAERTLAEAGRAVNVSAEVKRIERNEGRAWRQLCWAMKEMQSAKRAVADLARRQPEPIWNLDKTAAAPDPAPAPAPAPVVPQPELPPKPNPAPAPMQLSSRAWNAARRAAALGTLPEVVAPLPGMTYAEMITEARAIAKTEEEHKAIARWERLLDETPAEAVPSVA